MECYAYDDDDGDDDDYGILKYFICYHYDDTCFKDIQNDKRDKYEG